MVGFTQELSCTDVSTDACIFPPSIHPTLYKSMVPTRHKGLAPDSFLTLILFEPPPPAPVRRHLSLRRTRAAPSDGPRPPVLTAGRPCRS
jgi:hypothetical protein